MHTGTKPASHYNSLIRERRALVDAEQGAPNKPSLDGKRGRTRKLLLPILDAASQLFEECGFDHPTMEQVATVAGVRKATLYTYFDGKSALIEAVVARWLHEMLSASVDEHDTPLRQQLTDIGWQLHALSTHPKAVSLAKGMADASERLAPQQLQAWQRRFTPFEDHLALILNRHCDCDYPAYVAHQFVLLTVGCVDLTPASAKADTGARIDRAVELILLAYPEKT